jgi:chemotaxis protein histidine kinase CheA
MGGLAVEATGFGTLELDSYEEIHVLSRQLDEAAGDIGEVRRDLGFEMDNLTQDSEALSTIVSDLQSEITRARMITVETLFTRMQLPIRDAAQRMHRDVEIVTRGEEVAVDKSISDTLFGPLLHMVRNAVVHGIERPETRAALGKPRTGTISLVARQDQGQIVLEISDDGAGIDLARLKAAGVARGLVDATVPENDRRVLDLIFVHGLSTSEEAGDVAGRGVGGNVIRRAVDRLNGTIEIETKQGAGTTFRVSLPISMSITQTLLVRAA